MEARDLLVNEKILLHFILLCFGNLFLVAKGRFMAVLAAVMTYHRFLVILRHYALHVGLIVKGLRKVGKLR